MRKTTLHIISTLLFGAISLYIYNALIGIVAIWSNKQGLYSWILNLPQSLQKTAFLMHSDLAGFIVAIPVFGFFGLIAGFIVEKHPVFYGFLEFIGAISFFFIYHIFILDGNFMWMDSIPAWSQIFPFFGWLFILICTTFIGNKKLRPHIIKRKQAPIV